MKVFAINRKENHVIVSEANWSGNTITAIENVKKSDNPDLYDAVLLMSNYTKNDNFILGTFELMDKVCQQLYNNN